MTELLARFDREQRRDFSENNSDRDAAPFVVRHLPRTPHPRWGWVTYSEVTADNADAVIEAQIAFFSGRGLNFEWKWYSHDQPSDLPERLLARGFQAEALESVMVLDLNDAPASLWMPDDATIHRITDRAGLLDVVKIEDAVWNTPHDWIEEEMLIELAQAPQELSVYAAYADGEPAAAAWVRFLPDTQFASLWGGSTHPAYRKRGLYRALLAVRAREALDRGYRFLTVDASSMSRPILEKHGFICITMTRPFKWYTK